MKELDNQVAVVTGGGSGIGAATARLFAAHGARVAICGRTRNKLERTASEEHGCGEIVPLRADVSEPIDMQRVYADVERRWGRLDVVFAHAGINGVWAPIDELTPDEWQRTLQINLTGTFLTVKYAVPLLKRNGGAIVITSSINGTRKFSDVGSTAYSASKAAQLSVMRNLALELAEHRIRVNAVCPGTIETDVDEHMEMRDTLATEGIAKYRRGGIPLTAGRPGSPEHVAALVLFLVSRRAAHITGTPVWIDGGQSLVQA
jgi:NAD(P)-dependent dehydrogenase (short-subunit alcohol dehydrogenase family)